MLFFDILADFMAVGPRLLLHEFKHHRHPELVFLPRA